MAEENSRDDRGLERVLGRGASSVWDAEALCQGMDAVAGVVGNWGGVVSGLFNEP
jgi:hypothetical protein